MAEQDEREARNAAARRTPVDREHPIGGEMSDVLGGILRRAQLPWLLGHHARVPVLAIFSFLNGRLSIGIMSALAVVTHSPFIFPSLGPTAFLFFYTPTAPTASPRNTIVGHAIGVLAGYFSLVVTGLTTAGPALTVGVTWPWVIAAALSLGLTSGLMVLLKSPHPPAGATTLIISLGLLTQPSKLLILMLAVVLLTGQAFVINRLAGIPFLLWNPPREAPPRMCSAPLASRPLAQGNQQGGVSRVAQRVHGLWQNGHTLRCRALDVRRVTSKEERVNLLGNLLGGQQQQQDYQGFVDRYQQGPPSTGFSDQEAMDRYNQVASQLPPEHYQRAAESAFGNLPPDQRAQLGQFLEQQGQQYGLPVGGGNQQDPRYLAQMATQMHQQQPGLVSQLLGGALGGGNSGSGRMGGALSSPVARAALGGIAAMAVKQFMGQQH